MAGGAGTEVGRISIKVTPDTDGFRSELYRQLKAIEKSVKGQVPVSADVKTAEAVGQMARLMAKLKAQAAAGVNVDVDVRQRGDGFTRNLINSLKSLGGALGDAKRGIADYSREVKRLTAAQQQQSPLLMHDLAVLRSHNQLRRRGVQHVKDFAEALKLQQKWLRDANPELSASAARWKSWAMALRDANTNATNSVRSFKQAFKSLGNSDGGGGLRNMINRLLDFGDGADKASDSAQRSTRTFLGLSRMGWLVAAGFAGAAPAVGLVAGLIAGLPSLMMTFGAAAGAIALGLDGIKAAAATVQPQFEALKASVAQKWETGLTPVIQELGKLFPTFEVGMGQVTTGLIDMAKGMTTALTSGEGMRQLSTIFEGIGGFFTSIAPAMGQFTNSFLQLGSAGASSFGHLTAFISAFATQWQGMIDRVTNTPVFDQAMQGMSQALTGFTGLFTTLMESGLGAMSKLGEPLSNMFSGLGNLISAAMPGLTSFAGMIGNTIGNLGNSLAPAFAALGPVVDAIRPTIESLATTLGGVLSQAVVAIAPALTQLAQVMGPVLTQAATALAPIIGQLATTFGTILLTAVQALAPVMPQISAAFAALAAAVGQGLATVLPQLVQCFVQLLPTLVSLLPAFLQLLQAVIPMVPLFFQCVAAVIQLALAFAPLLSSLANVVSLVVQVIAKFAEWAATILTVVVGAMTQLVSSISQWMSQFFQTIADWLNKAVDKVREWGTNVASAIEGFAGRMLEAGKNMIQGLINGMGSMMGAAVAKAKEIGSNIWKSVTNFFGIESPSKLMAEVGGFVMEGLTNGMDANGSDAVAKMKEIAKAIFEAAKEVFGSAAGLNLAFNFGGGGGIGLGAGGAGGPFGGLASGMAGIASSAKDFQTNMANTVNPAKQLDAGTKQQLADLTQQLAVLEMQRKELELRKIGMEKGPALDALKAELESVRQQKLALGLQKDQLAYAQKYEGAVSDTAANYDQQVKDMAKMPLDFLQANAQTAMQDLGISGNGMLTSLAQQGLDYGSKFIFNVSNVDEAIAVKNNQINKESQGIVGR